MAQGDISEVKKRYLKLQEKYSLPDYSLVNKELEISTIDTTRFLLRQMRKKIYHRIDDFCEIIEDLLQPEATITQMHEYRFFSERAKTRIYDLYRKLMFMARHAKELHIENDKEKDVEFIKNFFNNLDEIKTEMLKITTTMKQSWKKEIDKDIKAEYFG